MDFKNVIIRHIVTEKAGILKDKNGKYTFEVNRNANKFQIKRSIEILFGVSVKSIRTLNYLGKSKKVGKCVGFKNDWKKAIVKLAVGEEIHMSNEF